MTTSWTGMCTIGALMGAVIVAACNERPRAPQLDATADRLRNLYEREWQWRLEEQPTLASRVGEHAYDDKLSSESLADYERRATETRAFLSELDAIDRNVLDQANRINYDVFRAQLTERVDAIQFGEHLMPLNADSGFHTDFAILPEALRFASARDYDNFVARLRAFPTYMDQNIELMREGLRRGVTIPKASLAGIETSIEPLIVKDAEQTPFWTPFTEFPPAVGEADRERLQRDARAAISDQVTPAYQRFLEFITKEYVPGARDSLAATLLPNGQEYYNFLVRKFTTLDLTADDVHSIGLEEVMAIRAEMDDVIRQTGFKGTFEAFLTYLRTNPRFYAKTGEDLLREASYIAKRVDAKLPKLFGRLPRQPYGVAPVPDYLAPKYTAGRYNGNPREGTEPGYYWVNTYALNTRPLYNLEALTLHEAVPGHHLQNAIAEELETIPPFRRYTYISAFGEGWGLYSEWLGLEAGFYTDPYSNFGRLTYAMWRAARLVVDTGIHAKGWTRQQAIDYLTSRTALSVHECTTETDRYISWPGQALSYKMGDLTIRELRKRAEQRLGPRFDVRRFHDAVLNNGSVPLPVLEQIIDDFIVREQGT